MNQPRETNYDSIPSEADWRSEPWGVDTPDAYRNLFGKSIAETVKLFEENSLRYQEDLMFMPARAFTYYIQAYCAYLLSEAARGDSDGASAFLSVIQVRAQQQPDAVRQQWSVIEPVLARLAADQGFYDASWPIYGDFRILTREIVEQGFAVSFDTSGPEIVPAGVTFADMGFTGRTFPVAVAVQLFRNSGICEITEASTKEDVVRALGQPEQSGGGAHQQFGTIPEWIRYRLPKCVLRIAFKEDRIADVMLLPLDDPLAPISTNALE